MPHHGGKRRRKILRNLRKIFCGASKTVFIVRQIGSSVTRLLIKINPVEDARLPKSQGPGQLPLLSYPSASAHHG